ncbi:hypothetical protein FZ025_03210 [Xanthomonas hyacinthi]|uniref:Uncharacterized protein n=1 Tax=Xanthomonas hyacinthi TaxID=56455 RepID=A0A2S7EP54_9XANT|nr:hypothetical protein XhyaCFBP1156_20425 [Xanthomonas hyacinthi]QGY75719.1 hypothetical protein FZ025_03210 [Xanthomonas hyacinthi]
MNGLVLSGVPGLVLSGVFLSCYQACEIAAKPITARASAPSNSPNSRNLTLGKSAPFRWTTTKRHAPAGFPIARAAP